MSANSLQFGDPLLSERFWQKVVPEPMSGCWLWTGTDAGNGYGVFRLSERSMGAHRYILSMSHYPWLKDRPNVFVCHKCDVSCCVNPDHLFLGSQADNMADKTRKGRQTKGVKHHRAKLNEEDVIEIRRLYATGTKTQKMIAKLFDVTQATIGYITIGATWRSVRGI